MSQQPYYAEPYGKQPVVVQGQVVQGQNVPAYNNNHNAHQQSTNVGGSGEEWNKGEAQPKRCNDVFWAILFYAHLGVMAWATAAYAPTMYSSIGDDYGGGDRRAMQEESYWGSSVIGRSLWTVLQTVGGTSSSRYLEEEDNNDNNDGGEVPNMNSVMLLLVLTFLTGLIISGLALSFMMTFAEGLIKFALWFNIIASLLVALLALATGAVPVAIMCFIAFAFSAYYAWAVWSRIPFAACNLVTAVTAVRANFGLSFFAYNSLLLLFGWSVWWSIASVASLFVMNGCNAAGECESEASAIVVFLFLVSYFWTAQVIKNVVHVTVAGTVGTWWFNPLEASSCCSRAICDSFLRAVTWSFGSICFGSLIVALIQATKQMVHQMRENGDGGMLLCCAEFLIGCIEALVEYFNQWAYVFVALYGYSFMEAGKNVMTLFRTRGWTTIITDYMIDNVLNMVSLGVGLVTGLIGLIVHSALGLQLGDGGGAIAFVIGLVIGFLLCATLMSVVSSAVNTVIVCYAEAPNEFQANHPELSEKMRASWRQAWPVEFNY